MACNDLRLTRLYAFMVLGGLPPLHECRMVELGNQFYKRGTLKDHFTPLVREHVSIDWNGRDGALKLDLGKCLPPEMLGQFDIVTNFGTSEHVHSQYRVFWNIHHLCKVGGLMFNLAPTAVPKWRGHAPFFHNLEFYSDLARLNEYKVWDLRQVPEDQNLIHAIFQKTREEWGIKKSRWAYEPVIVCR